MKEKDNIIMALDGATVTGWALYTNGVITAHGAKKFRTTHNNTRCGEYCQWLSKMIAKHHITHIVAEDTYRDHKEQRDKAFAGLEEMKGVVMAVTFSTGIGFSLIDNLKWRNIVFRNFRRYNREEYKQRMINRAKVWGYELKNDKADDEADAIGILAAYLQLRDFPVTHPNGKQN